MKLLTLRSTTAILVATLMLAGCSQPAPAPTAAPAKAPAAQAATAAPTKAPEPAKPAASPAPTAPPKVAYPEKGKYINLIIPWAAGSGTDVPFRILTPFWEKELGVPLPLINKDGASSQVGITELLRTKPDGYTLGQMALPTAAFLYLDAQRKAVFGRKDYGLVANYGVTPQMISVKKDSPYKTMKDLLDAARAKPGDIKIGDTGVMTTTHMTTLMVQEAAGVKFTSVHFSGGPQGVTAVLGGNVEGFAAAITNVLGQYKSGEMRVLGILDKQRDPLYPDIPTMDEQGLKVYLGSYHGVIGPAGLPKEVVDTWNAVIKKSVSDPATAKKVGEAGLSPRYLDPAQFSTLWDEMEGYVKRTLAAGQQ